MLAVMVSDIFNIQAWDFDRILTGSREYLVDGVPPEAPEKRCESSELRMVCRWSPVLLEVVDRPVALEMVEESAWHCVSDIEVC